MASFEPILRMDENAFRAPEKLQPKKSRKPLTNMTNSRKPPVKNKPSLENFSAFNPPEKVVQPKAGRKPLGDLTNSKQPRTQEVSSKKNCTENLSAVNKGQAGQAHSFGFDEGFLHNHDECIKANKQALSLSMDEYLESVGLKKDPSLNIIPQHPPLVAKPLELELEIDLLIEEMEMDFSHACASPPTPPTPKCPVSPIWDIKNMEIGISPIWDIMNMENIENMEYGEYGVFTLIRD